jgi:membrane associated rhomboid family serine protease
LGWLKTIPIVSLLLAVSFAAAPFAIDPARKWGDRFDRAIDEAREILVRNPWLAVDAEGERVLDPEWLAELREEAEETQAGAEVELPERMIARSQSQLDGLLSQAYEARRLADPSWRLGVLDGETPTRNYWAHAFIHDQTAGLLLILAVLLIVAAPLERSWGSLLFAAFVLLSIPVSAQGYRLLDASSGVPWCGTSGLAAALVGAYFIRGLGGRFIVPSVVVLPVWLAIEAFVVRGFWLDDLASVPWATLCGAVGFGAAVAALLRLLNVETKLDARAERRRPAGPNPILVRAARLRSDGDPNQAFELIQAAWRENRQDEEIADVFFSIAAELGQPEAAAEAILPVLRSALKKGQVDRALGYWLPLATRRCGVRLEPTAAVRLGEALLDAGHPDEAVFSLRSALDAGASTAHAIRILNVARDLDPGLTRRAASIALADPGLEAPMRAKLAPLADLHGEDSGTQSLPQREAPRAIAENRLDRSIEAEHHAIERTIFPSEPQTAQLEGQSLFGDALSEESLSDPSAPDAQAPDLSDAAPSDVLSHWNDRGALSAEALDGPPVGAPSSGHAVDTLLESTALAADGDLFGDDDIDFLDLEGDVTDSDQTPLLDASDELTSPMAKAARIPAEPENDATVMMSAGPTPAAPAPRPVAPASMGPTRALLRALRAIDAVPVEMTSDGIEIDTDGRGKSRLPVARIEAIAVAAVRGLGPRPVLVVDCILNWRDDIASPLKLIRFRSDRFDAASVGAAAAGTSPVAALGAWASGLQRASGAACLPSEALLTGSYASFDTLEIYEREVLGAERDTPA